MLNNLILVGRLTKEVEINETENGKKVASVSLAIPRPFKNMDGIYETDFITCTVWEDKVKFMNDCCKPGDIIGVRGRLQSNVIKTEEGSRYFLEVVADRVTFLSKSKGKNNKDVER